ncbi:hypothetical protein K1W54_00015 [Micromonospora sp. CPCC 205371]|nr:hypothetical protein [Micromonospora sp. CPCC 205371]
MFSLGLRRRTHGQIARAELGESFDHFRQAATHAASGMGETLGPLAAAAAANARQAGDAARRAKAKNLTAMSKKKESRMSRKRWPMLAGLLAAGAAVGAVGALVMRRRRQHEWEEYDPTQALESPAEAPDDALYSATDATTAPAPAEPAVETTPNSRP